MNYEEFLKSFIALDDRFIIMTAENRAAIRSLSSLPEDKFFDSGISEQALIGLASGLALRGRIPIVHALAAFLTMRSYEFIRTDIGIGKLPVKLVGSIPGFLSEANGPTHQSIEDIALMRVIPGMNIFCPADEEDMILGLPGILENDAPFYIRFNNSKPCVEHNKEFYIGEAEVIYEGTDICILTYGFLLKQAVLARNILLSEGIKVKIINLRTVKPIDRNTIIDAAIHSHLLVTLEDHLLTGGLYSIISEILVENQLLVKVLPVALKENWFKPGLLDDVLEYEGFTGKQIAEKIKAHYEINEIYKLSSGM